MFLDFMKSKSHAEVQNASLVPLNDPTVLFTTAGMHPLVPYLLGQPHPLGKRLTDVQKCVRTNDIEEVGDTTHLTFFEMLGYWSLGDYFKEDALQFSFEFYTSKDLIGFDPKRIYVTVFEGDENASVDLESIKIWKEIFEKKDIRAEVWNKENFNQTNLRIFPLNKKENWWGPAGETGPCGPDSEIFYWRGQVEPDFNKFVPWDNSGMFIEIGNDVFMEFNKTKDGKYNPLTNKNVDFGGGLERIVAIYNFREKDGSFSTKHSVYDTDIFKKIIGTIELLSGKKYNPDENLTEEVKAFRIVAEHSRSSVFILADGVKPAGKDQGYILRRLIRRMIRNGKKLGIENNFTKELALSVIEAMRDYYTHLSDNKEIIMNEIENEEIKFRKTLNNGLKFVQKYNDSNLTGEIAFKIYETYGFPLELILDEIKASGKRSDEIKKEFTLYEEKHKAQSRAGAEQKFKGGLADFSIETTKLHTAHHLLLAALQKIIDPNIKQKGSNITADRLRLDFNFERKLTDEEIIKIENLVNQKISEALPVTRKEMSKQEAEKLGAQMEFGQKYGDLVSVYFIGREPDYFSIEFCGGPHVSNTNVIGKGNKKFKIQKEESSGSRVRRIKAVLI